MYIHRHFSLEGENRGLSNEQLKLSLFKTNDNFPLVEGIGNKQPVFCPGLPLLFEVSLLKAIIQMIQLSNEKIA